MIKISTPRNARHIKQKDIFCPSIMQGRRLCLKSSYLEANQGDLFFLFFLQCMSEVPISLAGYWLAVVLMLQVVSFHHHGHWCCINFSIFQRGAWVEEDESGRTIPAGRHLGKRQPKDSNYGILPLHPTFTMICLWFGQYLGFL